MSSLIESYRYQGRHREVYQPSRYRNIAVVGTAAVVPFLFSGIGEASAASGDTWDQVAKCESGGNWAINTGNGFSGGLQFTPSTWRAYGGTGSPQSASRASQIAVAERVLAGQGWGAWPACSRKLGLSGGRSNSTSTSAPRTYTAPKTKTVKKAAPSRTYSSPKPKYTAPRSVPDSGHRHRVVRGETLSKIASVNGTSWRILYNKNRGVVKNPNLIYVGQTLNV